VVLKFIQVEDLKHVAREVRRFADALRRLASLKPPADRIAIDHPELARLVREFDGAAELVEKAVGEKFMTAAQYQRIARHFKAIADDMESGAAKESAAEKRRTVAGRRGAAPRARKPRPGRR
jgi:hypothetical protein